jgi:Predicted membrane protein
MTALSTALSVVIALALHMDYVWWAGISGFMSMQATRPGSIQRALLRSAAPSPAPASPSS